MSELRRTAPVFPVADVEKSLAWYGDLFQLVPVHVNRDPEGEEPTNYAVLSRDAVSLHLLLRDEAPYGLGGPVEAQFSIDAGLDALFAELRAKGARVLSEPEDRPWGARDFMVADPDGNVVWVSEPASP